MFSRIQALRPYLLPILGVALAMAMRLPCALGEETEAPLELEQVEPEALGATPKLSEADGAYVMDAGGNVLFSLNPDTEMEPASTTKVMSAMVILDSDKSLDDIVTIEEHEVGDGAQLADYGQGDQVPLGELFLVMLVYSGNDAAYNAARYVAGSEEAFVDLMNEKAKALGMNHTHFMNCHGYEADGHYSCARDLAIMGRYAMQNYPLIAQAVLLREVSCPIRGFPSGLSATDRLLDTYPGARGIKTGAVTNSYTFVGAVGRGDHQLYSAVVGCESWSGRFQDTTAMYDWCYGQLAYEPIADTRLIRQVNPFAYDLGLTVALRDQVNTIGRFWPMLQERKYRTHAPAATDLLMSGKTYGRREVVQDHDVPSGTAHLATDPLPVRRSAFTRFTRPLFEGV